MAEVNKASAWKHFFEERVKGNQDLVSGYLKYVESMEAKGLPPIFELRHLSRLIGVDEGFLVNVVQDPSRHYRTFTIPKRSGGTREISGPTPTLLFAQRWINSEILSKVDVHPSAHGFVKEKSIVSNARTHLGCERLLKMDLKDFFPSIAFKRVVGLFLQLGYPVSVSFFLGKICCASGCLPQGAATSPAISNLICRPLDKALCNYAAEANLAYSRYADDLTFSGDEINAETINRVTWIVNQMAFKLNEEKTHIAGPTGKKIVTGVSISSGKLALPRSSVRHLKLEVHQILTRGLAAHCEATKHYDPLLLERVLGRLSFWLQIDPDHPTANKLWREFQAYRDTFHG